MSARNRLWVVAATRSGVETNPITCESKANHSGGRQLSGKTSFSESDENGTRTPNCLFEFPRPAQAGCRNAKPAGISPTETMRQNAMSSFRASATIIFVLRAAGGPSVRTRRH